MVDGIYNITRAQAKNIEENHFKRTTERIQQLQSQLDSAPRTGKLKDKVCIITGVGSLKGIGFVCCYLVSGFY